MGETADAMLDGDLCMGCGVPIDNLGFGRYCFDCDQKPRSSRPRAKKVMCNICGKRVKKLGLEMHQRDKHGKI